MSRPCCRISNLQVDLNASIVTDSQPHIIATDNRKPTESRRSSSRASHHRYVRNVIPTGKTPSQSRIVNAQHLLTQSVALHRRGTPSRQYRFKERLKEGQSTLFGQRSQSAGGVRDLTKSLPEPEAA